MPRYIILIALLSLVACGGDGEPLGESQGSAPDAMANADATPSVDAAPVDAGSADAGVDPIDAGPVELELGQCRTAEDCANKFELCFAPGEFIGCGICQPALNPCNSDDECLGTGEICDSEPSDCLCGSNTCRPGCTTGSCEVGEACGEDGRCAAASCSSAIDCPANFDCGAAGCVRRSCTSDGACDSGGICVEGQCQEAPGSCSAIPA